MRRVPPRLAAGLALAMLAIPAVAAETKKEDTTPVQFVDALRFKLPADWPIKSDGAAGAGPVPLEEYLILKFNKLDAQLQALGQQMNSLDLRLRVFEEREKSQSLKSTEQRSP